MEREPMAEPIEAIAVTPISRLSREERENLWGGSLSESALQDRPDETGSSPQDFGRFQAEFLNELSKVSPIEAAEIRTNPSLFQRATLRYEYYRSIDPSTLSPDDQARYPELLKNAVDDMERLIKEANDSYLLLDVNEALETRYKIDVEKSRRITDEDRSRRQFNPAEFEHNLWNEAKFKKYQSRYGGIAVCLYREVSKSIEKAAKIGSIPEDVLRVIGEKNPLYKFDFDRNIGDVEYSKVRDKRERERLDEVKWHQTEYGHLKWDWARNGQELKETVWDWLLYLESEVNAEDNPRVHENLTETRRYSLQYLKEAKYRLGLADDDPDYLDCKSTLEGGIALRGIDMVRVGGFEWFMYWNRDFAANFHHKRPTHYDKTVLDPEVALILHRLTARKGAFYRGGEVVDTRSGYQRIIVGDINEFRGAREADICAEVEGIQLVLTKEYREAQEKGNPKAKAAYERARVALLNSHPIFIAIRERLDREEDGINEGVRDLGRDRWGNKVQFDQVTTNDLESIERRFHYLVAEGFINRTDADNLHLGTEQEQRNRLIAWVDQWNQDHPNDQWFPAEWKTWDERFKDDEVTEREFQLIKERLQNLTQRRLIDQTNLPAIEEKLNELVEKGEINSRVADELLTAGTPKEQMGRLMRWVSRWNQDHPHDQWFPPVEPTPARNREIWGENVAAGEVSIREIDLINERLQFLLKGEVITQEVFDNIRNGTPEERRDRIMKWVNQWNQDNPVLDNRIFDEIQHTGTEQEVKKYLIDSVNDWNKKHPSRDTLWFARKWDYCERMFKKPEDLIAIGLPDEAYENPENNPYSLYKKIDLSQMSFKEKERRRKAISYKFKIARRTTLKDLYGSYVGGVRLIMSDEDVEQAKAQGRYAETVKPMWVEVEERVAAIPSGKASWDERSKTGDIKLGELREVEGRVNYLLAGGFINQEEADTVLRKVEEARKRYDYQANDKSKAYKYDDVCPDLKNNQIVQKLRADIHQINLEIFKNGPTRQNQEMTIQMSRLKRNQLENQLNEVEDKVKEIKIAVGQWVNNWNMFHPDDQWRPEGGGLMPVRDGLKKIGMAWDLPSHSFQLASADSVRKSVIPHLKHLNAAEWDDDGHIVELDRPLDLRDNQALARIMECQIRVERQIERQIHTEWPRSSGIINDQGDNIDERRIIDLADILSTGSYVYDREFNILATLYSGVFSLHRRMGLQNYNQLTAFIKRRDPWELRKEEPYLDVLDPRTHLDEVDGGENIRKFLSGASGQKGEPRNRGMLNQGIASGGFEVADWMVTKLNPADVDRTKTLKQDQSLDRVRGDELFKLVGKYAEPLITFMKLRDYLEGTYRGVTRRWEMENLISLVEGFIPWFLKSERATGAPPNNFNLTPQAAQSLQTLRMLVSFLEENQLIPATKKDDRGLPILPDVPLPANVYRMSRPSWQRQHPLAT